MAIVTGVSRRKGIGFAIARRLLADGLKVVIHSWSAMDRERLAASDPTELASVIEQLGGVGPRLASIEADFADPGEPARVIQYAVSRFGAIDVLIVNHAMSAEGRLSEVSSADLDLAWAVNARAAVLLVQG